jgi:hypothetical protein
MRPKLKDKTDITKPPLPPNTNMDLLTQMAAEYYQQPTQIEISEEERLRKQWEDMARNLDSSQLRVASRNYSIWCARQRERKNQTA